MVLEHQGEHPSQWAAIGSIASKIGCTSETLRLRHKVIETSRLRLIRASLAFIEAELAGGGAFAELMRADQCATVPPEWPPELYERAATEWMKKYLTENPDAGCWTMYYIAHDGVLIGTCGYKGKPDATGTVEIGYGLLPAWHRRGLGTEAAAALVEQAFAQPGVRRVIAETLPELRPSIRVLEKLGFSPAGAGEEEGVIRFELLSS